MEFQNEKWYKKESKINMEFLDNIPYRSGVYAIYFYPFKKKIAELIYIGSALSLKKRILTYKLDNYSIGGGINTTFGYASDIMIKFKLVKEYGKWLMDEAKLIRRLNPKHNNYHKTKK
ncbi:MAG: GIY-YIG nuclease family protein [Bacteroidetes bacterium]|nr:GIY-YIG nuclease family protein [Bacteroidota bacterium]